MDFSDDPRREQIEPMFERVKIWAAWSRSRPERMQSPTYNVMQWIEDHAEKRDNDEEVVITGEPIRISTDNSEEIALRVEHCLCQLRTSGYARDVFVLKTFFTARTQSMYRIAKQLRCKTYQVDALVCNSLYRLSTLWRE